MLCRKPGKIRSRSAATLSVAALLASSVAGAAEFVVLNDETDGSGSFFEAFQLSENTRGDDTIVFDSSFFSQPRSITLPVALTVSEGLTIDGPGRSMLTLVNHVGNGIALFYVEDAGNNVPITFSVESLTIESNAPTSGINRRQIFSRAETIFLRDVELRGNGSFYGNSSGAAIAVVDGSLTMQDCLVTDFESEFRGGAVFVRSTSSQSVMIERCAFRNNSVSGNALDTRFEQDGGALFVKSDLTNSNTILIAESEFSNNRAFNHGGAVALSGYNNLTVSNSTISNNTAPLDGGGIYMFDPDPNFQGVMRVEESTITANTARNGGGVSIDGDLTQAVLIVNSIVAGNTAVSSNNEIANGEIVAGYSLIGDDAGDSAGLAITEHNASIGSMLYDMDPGLGALASNGGPTRTHALLASSPLVDAGRSSASPRSTSAFPTTDQRGTGFSRVEGAAPDMGAFEYSAAPVGGGNGGGASGGGGAVSPMLMILFVLVSIGRRRRAAVSL